MTNRVIALIAAAAVIAVFCAAALAAISPAALQRAILHAADAQRSVHYVATQSQPSKGRKVVIVGDAGRTLGIQHITFTASGRTGRVTVVVVSDTAFIRGDAFTLSHYMGFPTAIATTYAGGWIKLPHTSSGFSTVAAGVRLSSAISELKVFAPLENLAATTLDGKRVIGLGGRPTSKQTGLSSSVHATLYASATGAPLPLREVAAGSGVRLSITLSRWNERFHLPGTRGATPVSKLKAGAPA